MAAFVNNTHLSVGLGLIDANSATYTVIGQSNTSGAVNFLVVNSTNYVVFSSPGTNAMLNLNEVMNICLTANLANTN